MDCSRYAVARALRDSSLMLKLWEFKKRKKGGGEKTNEKEESGARTICHNPFQRPCGCAEFPQRPICALINGHWFILLKVRGVRSAPDHTARAKKGVVTEQKHGAFKSKAHIPQKSFKKDTSSPCRRRVRSPETVSAMLFSTTTTTTKQTNKKKNMTSQIRSLLAVEQRELLQNPAGVHAPPLAYELLEAAEDERVHCALRQVHLEQVSLTG